MCHAGSVAENAVASGPGDRFDTGVRAPSAIETAGCGAAPGGTGLAWFLRPPHDIAAGSSVTVTDPGMEVHDTDLRSGFVCVLISLRPSAL